MSVSTNGASPAAPLERSRPVNLRLQRLVDRYWPSKVARENRKRSRPGWRALPEDRGEWTFVAYGGAALGLNMIATLELALRDAPDGARRTCLNRLKAAVEVADRERIGDVRR